MDKNLNHAIIEVTPRAIDVRYDQTCTNHFKLLTHENRNYTKESTERLNRLIDHAPEQISKHEAFKLFNNPKNNIYSKLFNSWSGTIHTSMYEPQSLSAWIALGENNKPSQFNFQQWLDGQPINQHTFEGQVDTDLTFATY